VSRARRAGLGPRPARGPVRRPAPRPFPGLPLGLVLALGLLLGLALAASPALAAQYTLRTGPDGELLSVTFANRPGYGVVRTGERTLLIPLSPETLRAETLTPGGAGELVRSVRLTDKGLEVEMSTPGFGYLAVPQPVRQAVDIHVFRDPFGERWAQESKPRPRAAEAPAAEKPRQSAPEKSAPADKARAAKSQNKTQPPAKPEAAKPEAAKPDASKPGTAPKAEAPKKPESQKPAKGKPPLPETDLAETQPQPPSLEAAQPTPAPAPARPMLPSNAMRAGVLRVGPDEAKPMDALVPGPETAQPAPGANAPAPSGGRMSVAPPPGGAGRMAAAPPPPAAGGGSVPASGSQASGGQAAPGQAANASGQAEPGPAPSPSGPQGANATGLAEGGPAPGGNATAAGEEAPPPPMDPAREKYETLFLEAQGEMSGGNLASAANKFKDLLANADLPQDMREESLYNRAEILATQYRDSMKDHFDEVTAAYNAAMNANPSSSRAPTALINLGLLHLKAGNLPEASAYFNLLKTNYPKDQNIPAINFYWGDYYMKRGEWQKAADAYQDLVQNTPDFKLVREAALGLAHSLDMLGNYKQAYQILDYIDKRWPRYYVDNPDFLRLFGEMANVVEKYEEAKNRYWTFYNLEPKAEGNDVVLAALGDIYLRLGKPSGAKEVYEKAATEFPDKEGGLVAKMRLAEEGIHDKPTLEEMGQVFDRPFNLKPQQIYTQIIRDFPQSTLAPLAQMKLAMWYFYNKRYGDTLRAVQDFITKYPQHALLPRAEELGLKVFNLAVPELVHDENYGRILEFWANYKPILEKAGVSDDLKMAVALSYFKRGEVDTALKQAKPYLGPKQDPKFSEMSLDMALSAYLDRHAWSDIVNLGTMVQKNWKVDPNRARQVDYALAMAHENLGETDKSAPIWEKLATDDQMDPAARAYGMYYQAKAAMKAHDLRKVFIHSQQALEMFLASGGDRDKIKDCILMTIYAAEASGQYREALKWANKYDTYIPETDPEWASARFRLAKLYQLAGAQPEWEKLMKEIRDKKPDTLYGKMASTALEATGIEKQVREFQDNAAKK
jgi:tetratricopeptide (TPR) repeat protein